MKGNQAFLAPGGGKPEKIIYKMVKAVKLRRRLLKQAEHRDGDTWAIHTMECQDKGLNLEYTIADFGKGLRA